MSVALASRESRPSGASAELPLRTSLRTAWRAFWTSRLVVFLAGVLAVEEIWNASWVHKYDPAGVTAPFNYLGNLLVSPFARWDSVWYLTVSLHGYDHHLARTAFFPLYPGLMAGLGLLTGSDLVAGILISMVAFAVALVLLHQLAWLELGERGAETTVMLIAFSPMAYYFSAVYTEGLYLALSVGCLLCARKGRWFWAGLLGGLAAASRNSGALLIIPVVLLFLYGPRTDRAHATARWVAGGYEGWRRLLPRHRLDPRLLWALLIPAGVGAYILFLALSSGNGLAPFHAEAVWNRQFAGPFGGVWKGLVAAWDGLRQLVHGTTTPRYFPVQGNPLHVGTQNLMLFGSLVLGALALVGVFRGLPFAYGAYCVVSLAMPLSYPARVFPLSSLPRYEVVLFPLFMWAAVWLTRRRLTAPGIGSMAVLLGLFSADFATWRFIA
ncbi:MAG TPA: mannosyltransferase family protein [Solirubrobacteraceae bacterium]|nr:mannosyltransferase family protein [Solirubrobacteraceae bacterium]